VSGAGTIADEDVARAGHDASVIAVVDLAGGEALAVHEAGGSVLTPDLVAARGSPTVDLADRSILAVHVTPLDTAAVDSTLGVVVASCVAVLGARSAREGARAAVHAAAEATAVIVAGLAAATAGTRRVAR
jgi:hypothetical protein